ncbi:MAG: succinate dehydrogenase flavoprotein subunit [Anaerolineae bacterium]
MATLHKFDAVVIGAGGAGLWASYELSKAGVNSAVITKLYPTRSHTGTAQGGIAAALGNMEEDHPDWHMFDTVKGGDYLVDQDAAAILAEGAVKTVIELEHMGLPFDRTPDGKIEQRRFGGHTKIDPNDPNRRIPVMRACKSADRTGHMILQTLYQQNVKYDTKFFNEFQVLDLLVDGRSCRGVVAIEIATGELHIFHTKAVIIAAGGFGKMFKITSNAHSLTGDLPAICYRHGIPMEDMEFFQFHPTGVHGKGILISEAARGEGGILYNSEGERFMDRYAPTMKELAPRDMISRFIYQEIRAGRGIGPEKDAVWLDVTPETITKLKSAAGGKAVTAHELEVALPDILEFVRLYEGLNPMKERFPIQPTAHYAMGGIPTDSDGRVLADEKNTVIRGLYAAGECACVSVHGANRLGTNSLLDILVFGQRSGQHAAGYVKTVEFESLPSSPDEPAYSQLNQVRNATGKESVADIRKTMQVTMDQNVSVFRNAADMQKEIGILSDLRERYQGISIQDKGKKFNTDLLEAIELGYLLDLAYVTATSALNRTESRGAQAREDYPKRDDVNWLKHTFVYKDNNGVRFAYKPVVITKFQPMERKY